MLECSVRLQVHNPAFYRLGAVLIALLSGFITYTEVTREQLIIAPVPTGRCILVKKNHSSFSLLSNFLVNFRGGASGASAIAIVASDCISRYTSLNGVSGYTSVPTVVILSAGSTVNYSGNSSITPIGSIHHNRPYPLEYQHFPSLCR
jgi:hypothetical protein